VCLAGVLACKPSVLIMDEPTANLDPRARRRFLSLISSLNMTKLIATHDLEMVLEICDRVLLLDGGQLIADGSPVELLSNKELVEAHGLEVPPSLAGRNQG
jgi:cobalt/nickel transport system ATP-binding protein